MLPSRVTAAPPEEPSSPNVVAQGAFLKVQPPGPCPRCAYGEDPSCDCQELRRRCTLFNQAALPALYVQANLDAPGIDDAASLSLRRALRWVQEWARRDPLPGEGLLLSGPNGVGKSFLLAGLARTLTLARGIRCSFVDFGHLLLRLKAAFDGKGAEYEVFESLQRPSVLMLDDIGSHRDSAWSRDVLQTIIASRYNACAITFLTTNLPIARSGTGYPSPFEKWVGAHCASRLAEMCFWLPVDGPDRRRRRLLQPGTTAPKTP